MNRRPNWFAAACGLAYVLCFLFLPVYNFITPYRGTLLLSIAPVVIVLLVCGLLMIVSSLLLDKRISIGVGAVSAVLTLIFGLLGKQVLPLSDLTGVVDQGLNNLLGFDMNVGSFMNVRMGYGMIFCLLICVAHIVLEILIDCNVKTKRIQPDLWEDNDSGPIDF